MNTFGARASRGESFAPADAVIAGHPGDWHVAMERYANWAHEVWQFRPYPSKLRTCHNMLAAGWGTGYLFRDGGVSYRYHQAPHRLYRADVVVGLVGGGAIQHPRWTSSIPS